MTLCVAWEKERQIHLASDSRMSGIGDSDYGLKILSIPIKIFSTERDKVTNKFICEFDYKYGMGFEGSFVGAYTIREFLMIVLQRLQYIENSMEISFESICNIVYKFYNHIFPIINNELHYDHSINFFLTGFCPKSNEIKIAHYFTICNLEKESYTPKFKIIEKGNFIKAIGTGDETFMSFYKRSNDDRDQITRVLNSIKKTIDSKEVGSVGGNIQYGTFEKLQFETFGVIEDIYNENGVLEVKHSIAGIDMNGDEFESVEGELYIMGQYLSKHKL